MEQIIIEYQQVSSIVLSVPDKVSIAKLDKIPWLSEASLVNKPLVLSLPQRSSRSCASFLVSSKKDLDLPFLFEVPGSLYKEPRSQSNPVLSRSGQLCSTCREMKMVQPRTVLIPDDLNLSFGNYINHRMLGLQSPRAETVPKSPQEDILTESVHYRLPILGPRTAVFSGLLSQTYKTLQEKQLPSFSRKESTSKATKRC
ncbi:PREDICTED: uncharacterized protein C1orf105 homolog [Elephantulus edwardii]|uniref:uncharacterized protein C1orf105 homolog n=1 Tax=Elephantulus edwardii TaxID=28737 RepID=UPI0003F0E7E9|nr:PREDICTED: uncharacterized protein C1orf105 homolog [Elephantulus edwardii]